MSDLVLTLDKAVAVVMENFDTDETDEKWIRSELEQKCYINSGVENPRKELIELIMDVNPAEIASQIEADNLRDWCKTMQVGLQMLLMQIGGKE